MKAGNILNDSENVYKENIILVLFEAYRALKQKKKKKKEKIMKKLGHLLIKQIHENEIILVKLRTVK